MPKYAQYNPALPAPQPVLAWYDTDMFTYPNLPSEADMIELSGDAWDQRLSTPFVSSGVLVGYSSTQILRQAQSAQITLVTKSYNTATDYVPITINGTTYQVDNTAGKQALNLSLAITANAMMQSPAWVADTGYSAGAYCSVGGVILFCSTPGKSGSSAPTPPTTFGTPVTDGTAAWELLGRKVYLQDGSFVYMTPQEIMSAFQQGELYLHQMSDQLELLKSEINAATTVTEVQTFTF